MASCFVRVSLHDEPPFTPHPPRSRWNRSTPGRPGLGFTRRQEAHSRSALAAHSSGGIVRKSRLCCNVYFHHYSCQNKPVVQSDGVRERDRIYVCVFVCVSVRASVRVCATHARRGEDAGNLGKTYTTSSQIALSRESCAARETSRAARLQGASVCAQRQRACTAKACAHSSFQRGFMAYSRFHFRAWSRAACSLLFHCSAASLFRGSSGFGADMSA